MEQSILTQIEDRFSQLLTLDGGLSYAAKAAGVNVMEVNRSDADVS